MAIVIKDENTWPMDIIAYLDEHFAVLNNWYARDNSDNKRTIPWQIHDKAYYGLRDVLNQYSLRGYHCTRLTTIEMDEICRNGMSLPDLDTLIKRISRIEDEGLITSDVCNDLKSNNRADNDYEDGRAGEIWFCFFDLNHDREQGIGRLLRSWGGEAVYADHEKTKVGAILRTIGVPSIVEAHVPIRSLCANGSLVTILVRNYLNNRKILVENDLDCEGYAVESIPAASVKRIIQYPSGDFIEMTGCADWSDKWYGEIKL